MRPVLLLLLTVLNLAACGPLTIAHRGGAALRTENSLAAFEHALSLGVEVLEFDLQVTADGHLVLHHDAAVNPKVCKAPDGSTLRHAAIGELTLAEIRQFNCGGEPMPTIGEFFTFVKQSTALLLGEIKPVSNPEQAVDLLHAALRKHGLEKRFILQSGDYAAIDAMRRKDPAIARCLLNARRFQPPQYVELARRHKATHIMLRDTDAAPADLRKLRKMGVKIYSGTANEPSQWKRYVELGFDGILTDDPAALRKFLNQ